MIYRLLASPPAVSAPSSSFTNAPITELASRTCSHIPRQNTNEPPPGWTDDAAILDVGAHERKYLEDNFLICCSGLSFLLKHRHDDIYLITAFKYSRFFLWNSAGKSLRYVRTLYNLLGLYRALDANEVPETNDITEASILPCPPEHKPEGWTTLPDRLLSTEYNHVLSEYGLREHEPIMTYITHTHCEAMTFLRCEGRYYINNTDLDFLREIISPDMSDSSNWKQLEGAKSGFPNLEFVEIGTAEIFGGRRILDASDIPDGWEQLSSNACASMGIDGSITPPQAVGITSSVVSRKDGVAHVLEIRGQYYMWFPEENGLLKIVAQGGLAEILRTLKEDGELKFKKFKTSKN